VSPPHGRAPWPCFCTCVWHPGPQPPAGALNRIVTKLSSSVLIMFRMFYPRYFNTQIHMYSDPAHWDFICYDPEDYLKVRPRRRWRTAGALALTRHAERGQLLERPCTQPAPPAAGLCGTTASGSLLASCPSTRSHIRSMSGATCWTTTSPPATLSMPTRSDRASGERAACVSWRAVAASAGPAEQAAVVEEAAVAGVPHPHPLLSPPLPPPFSIHCPPVS
jgi:hypothetical protein